MIAVKCGRKMPTVWAILSWDGIALLRPVAADDACAGLVRIDTPLGGAR